MDVYKQKRYLIITIVLLVLLNLASLFLLWYGHPSRHLENLQTEYNEQDNERIKQLLKEVLSFDENQIEEYLMMRYNQKQKVLVVQNDIQQIKKQMFDAVLKDNPPEMLSDSLLTLSKKKMGELEQLTYDYFLSLRKLCKPEQIDKLKILMGDYFHNAPPMKMNDDGRPPGPPGENPDGPPPGEMREGNPPPPPNRN